MSRPEEPAGRAFDGPEPPNRRYGRYVGVLGLVILALITLNTVLTPPNGASGIAPGGRLAPFAVPLVTGGLPGDADIARGPHEGAAGAHPACSVRGRGILNVCELYEHAPLVLVLFVDAGGCPDVLSELQSLVGDFSQVRFAAVSIKGKRGSLLRLIDARHLSMPVGIDRDGVLAGLYKLSGCPQLNFAYPGGTVQSRALLQRPSLAVLRARIERLLADSRARGWREP